MNTAVLSEIIRETGRREELEQDKMFCLLLDVQEKMRQELAEEPSYRGTMDLERLRTILTAYRTHMREGRDLFDQVNGWLQRVEHDAERLQRSGRDTDRMQGMLRDVGLARGLNEDEKRTREETQDEAWPEGENMTEPYPMDPLYHMAVAEQERDLYRLYPSKFNGEL